MGSNVSKSIGPVLRHGAVWAIEDDPHQLELLVMSIRCWPSEVPVLTAVDGAMAMTQIEHMPPTRFAEVVRLVLLDLRLPRLHGMDLLARASELGLTEQAPFIVFTSSDSPDERARALRLGARDYLVKPLGFKPLQSLLGQLYERWIAPARPPP